MLYKFNQKVYYSDTDAYGVVWHGAYLRWLEMGRVCLCEEFGLNLVEMQNNDVVLPVVGLNIRYKSSAKLNDEMTIETSILKFNSLSATFTQTIRDAASGKVFIQAEIDIVAVNNAGKLYRKMPELLLNAFGKACCLCV